MTAEDSKWRVLSNLETESPNPYTVDIDSLDTIEILTKINEEDRKVPFAVAKAIPEIAKVVELCVAALRSGGRVIYVGAGTSGRIGFLDATEVVPTFGVPEGIFIAVIAGGREALVRSVEFVEDNADLGAQDLANLNICKKDVVIGITASGRTPYVRGALLYARNVGATTALICNVSNPELEKYAHVTIKAVTGAEVITGSTRMKAGSAQKMILNMISTATMIKLGKVYKNYMVDVMVLNEKLEQRALRIIMDVTGVSEDIAFQYLRKADNKPKLAILMILSNKPKEVCAKALEKTGSLREALRILEKAD